MDETGKFWRAVGEKFWPVGFGRGPEHADDWGGAEAAILASLKKENAASMSEEDRARLGMWAVVGSRWYHNGMPRVVVGHRHAASLMCTSMAPDLVADLKAPWDVFMVDIPSGMVPHPEAPHAQFQHALVLGLADGAWAMALPDTQHANVLELRGSSSLAALAADNARSGEPAARMIARLVVGVTAEIMEHRAAQYAERGAGAVRRDGRGAPVTRTFVVTRPVQVDCRPAVAAAMGGGRAVTVQSLVHGHWKAQPYGPELALRKRIHVEPYWRGPEDAPLALRPHRLRAPGQGEATGDEGEGAGAGSGSGSAAGSGGALVQ